MAKVTFLLGLAGSGKSFLADNLKKETGAAICEGVAGAHHTLGVLEVINHLRAGRNCIVEEIAYCLPEKRDEVVHEISSHVPDVEIKWICLENDLESANWNVKNRMDKSEVSEVNNHLYINEQWHSRYIYPEGAEIKPITRADKKHA